MMWEASGISTRWTSGRSSSSRSVRRSSTAGLRSPVTSSTADSTTPKPKRTVGPLFVVGAVLASSLLASGGTLALVSATGHAPTVTPAAATAQQATAQNPTSTGATGSQAPVVDIVNTSASENAVSVASSWLYATPISSTAVSSGTISALSGSKDTSRPTSAVMTSAARYVISRLISAANRVRGGDLLARVPEGDEQDELALLSRAFNRMTSQLESQREWIANLRDFYRFMPFSRSTYRHATAIIVASSQTYSEFPAYTDKLFFIPEPGIDLSVCSSDTRRPEPGAKLELIFVGGLVPRKACDLALRGAAELLRSDVARFTVLGDGPERQRLEELVRSPGIEKAVTFRGWVGHEEVFSRLRSADLFVFPSLRDNGAGVVFQALACGAVPVVADFGGPGDIVTPEVGYKVPVTNEADLVSHLDRVLKELAGNRDLLKGLRERGMSYAKENLTWDAKAQRTTQVLNWAVRRAPKPVLLPPVRGGGRPGTEKPRYA